MQCATFEAGMLYSGHEYSLVHNCIFSESFFYFFVIFIWGFLLLLFLLGDCIKNSVYFLVFVLLYSSINFCMIFSWIFWYINATKILNLYDYSLFYFLFFFLLVCSRGYMENGFIKVLWILCTLFQPYKALISFIRGIHQFSSVIV